MNTKINWVSKLYLEGSTATGHTVKMDSAPAGMETNGPTPKELLLQALAGCTMMDVVTILEKSRKHLDKFWIDVEAELAKEHPKVFTKINLKYNFLGEDLDESTIKRAIDLSRERYCAIYNVLKNQVDITCSYEINKEIEAEI